MTTRHPALVAWPGSAAERAELAAAGTPRVLVLAPGAPVPVLAADEDWVHRSTDERDVAARLASLARRRADAAAGSTTAAPSARTPVLPVGLASDQHRVAARLLGAPGALVRTADLPVEDLDRVVARLRPVLHQLGWQLHRVGAAGYLVEPLERSA